MKNDKNFYKAFEDRYRGTRELIKNRVSVYLPFIEPLKRVYPDSMVLDLGCGRGEWLEVLSENSFLAKGVDSDEGMLNVCHDYKLNVEESSIIPFLKRQRDESAIVVSALHVVEHIPFDDLLTLVKESLRILKPGGVVILETPNPQNIKVSTENFYLDPTHIKPIPPGLLSFLPEFYGFARTKVLGLQESEELQNKEDVTILQVIEGVSPDYATIAQKDAQRDILKEFDKIFIQNRGLSLETLAQKFENRLVRIETKVNKAEANIREALHKADEAEARTEKIQQEYNAVLNSNSWKLTKPLRSLRKILKL